MRLCYKDTTANYEDDLGYYDVYCPKCQSNNILDINYNSEWIDGSNVVEITLKCEECGTVWGESEVNLEIFEY